MGTKLTAERTRQVMDVLATGVGPMETARLTGVSKSKVYRMHHSVGGVYRPPTVTYSKRYLDRDERYEIARLWEAGESMTDIAALIGRATSTVSRELDRNANPETERYEPERADRMAYDSSAGPKNQSCPGRRSCARKCRKCWTRGTPRTRCRVG